MNYYFDWSMNSSTGWGVYGANLVKYGLLAGHKLFVIGGAEPKPDSMGPMDEYLFRQFHSDSSQIMFKIMQKERLTDVGRPVLRALGAPDFVPEVKVDGKLENRYFIRGAKNIGVLFSEDSILNQQGTQLLAQRLDGVICGSTWNAEVLAQAGYPRHRILTILQGVDTDYFFPHKPVRRQDGYFYFFSGGKIELRKGQDVVLAAFAEVWKRFPHCRLVTAWQFSSGSSFASDMNHNNFMEHPWVIDGDRVNIKKTAVAYGIAPEAIIELPVLKNSEMPNILRLCHAGLFPNRCEGGTNLVAMEAMACGLPCVIADNTGQKDLLSIVPALRSLSLTRSRKLEVKMADGSDAPSAVIKMKDWHWPFQDEMVEKMTNLVTNYAAFESLGDNAANLMKSYSWRNQIQQILSQTDKLPQAVPSFLGLMGP